MNAIGWILGNAAEAAVESDEGGDGHAARFAEGVAAKRFMLAGNARLTLVSGKTGTRFTFRVKVKAEEGRDPVHFVSVLSGSNNEADFSFLGTIFEGARYAHGRRSRIGREAPSAQAFAWAARYLLRGELPPGCEVHHEGRCGACGRALTVPESILSGLGPVCAARE